MIVLDSSALLAWLLDEPEADAIEDVVTDARTHHLSALTLFEARTVAWGRVGLQRSGDLDAFLRRIAPTLHPFDETQASLAFAAYRRFGKGSGHRARLNLGDCAAYALAMSLDLPLLFKGNDFVHTDVRSALDASTP